MVRLIYLSILLFGCGQNGNDKPLSTGLSPGKTGVTFQNTLREDARRSRHVIRSFSGRIRLEFATEGRRRQDMIRFRIYKIVAVAQAQQRLPKPAADSAGRTEQEHKAESRL